MAERFPGMKVVSYEVFGNNHGSRQHELIKQVPDKLRQHKVDAVISLVGA
jgi:ribosomal protein L20A (L18A)